MALAVDQRFNVTGSGSPEGSITITNVVVSAISPLIVGVASSGSAAVSSVVYNGTESLSVIGTETAGSGTGLVASLYGIKNPTVGTHNVVVTFSGTPDTNAAFAISTTGGDTSTGWRSAFVRDDDVGTGPGLTVTDAQAGDIVFHVVYGLSSSIVFDGGETSTNTEIDNVFGSSLSMGLSTKPASGSTTVGTTDMSAYAEVAVAVIPSAGGGAALRKLSLMQMGMGR